MNNETNNAKGPKSNFRRRRPKKRPNKRPRSPNRYVFRYERATTSIEKPATIPTTNPVKKLKIESPHSTEVPINAGLGYRLIDFLTFFSTLSGMIKCKSCDGNVTFSESSICGLGFKLVVTCNNCEPRYITSCPLIDNTYDVNRRIVFAMKFLGVGYEGIKKFCGIMDLSKALNKRIYDDIMINVYYATKTVADLIFSEAAAEEKKLTANAENTLEPAGLIVSGNRTWRKSSFALQCVTTLIGHYSGKIIDLIFKSSCKCKQCELRKIELDLNTKENETWKDLHKEDCFINHAENLEKIEVAETIEMFARSEKLHGIKYLSYIGDSDSKTFKGITESQPYGENIIIKKREFIDCAQKRMNAQLCKVKEDTKGLDGKEGLTENLINKLSLYYGLAIKNNKDSIEDMYRAIWATLQHKSSTNENPHHDNCPPGPDSWCTWQKAKANNRLNEYTHKALSNTVLNAIIPVYQELSKENLLQYYLGGFIQNNKITNFNSLIWSFAPKVIINGVDTIEIATYIAACIFNKGYTSVLLMMHTMNLIIGPNAAAMCEQQDEMQISISKAQAFEMPKEGFLEQQTTGLVLEDVVCKEYPQQNTKLAFEDVVCKEEGPSYDLIVID